MRINKLNAFILMAVVLALPLFTGCVSQPGIERAVVSAAVSKTGEPVLASDNFTPDVNTIYCSIKLSAPSAKSTVRADWFLVKSEEAGISDTMIGTGTVAAETPFVVSSFSRAEAPLPRGEYMVKLYFDNKFAQSVPFQIQGEPAAPLVKLEDAAMSTGIDVLSGKPLNSVSVFPADSPIVYGSAKVGGGDFNDQVTARWIYEGGELGSDREQKVAESTLKLEGREYLNYSISPKEGKPFPKGQYSLRFYVGDIEQLKLPFSVVGEDLLPALYVGAVNVYTFKDTEQKEINATSRFSADIPVIFFRAKIYNAPPGTQMTVQWIIVSSDEAGVDDYQIAEDKNTIDGTLAIAAKLATGKDKLVKGDYTVKLLLNGEEKLVIPFIVQ